MWDLVNNPKLDERVVGNDEWKDHELSWNSVDHLDEVKLENTLEGFIFLKEERESFTKTGKSIFWK